MGHFVAARQRGLDVGAPTFIPFVGAWINLRDQPHNVETEAYVAAAGPLVGTVAAVAVYLWGRSTDSGLLLAIAYAGLFLNLFNLLPLSPLDGGRITAIISPRVWLIGTPLMLVLLIYRPSPVLLVLAMPQLV
jgi:Zn-dependent protease